MKTYSDDAANLAIAFKQLDGPGRVLLIERLRDIAIGLLQSVVKSVDRHLSDRAKAGFYEAGINLSWNLYCPDDAREFCFTAKNRDVPLSATQRAAMQLLHTCSYALARGEVLVLWDKILRAYAALDVADVEVGREYRRGQSERAQQPRTEIRGIVRELCLAPGYQDHTAAELWPRMYAAMDSHGLDPKEIRSRNAERAHYAYEGASTRRTLSFGRFATVVSECRREHRKKSR